VGVCPYVRLSNTKILNMSVQMNAEISETLRARLLRFGVQIEKVGIWHVDSELLAQRKFV